MAQLFNRSRNILVAKEAVVAGAFWTKFRGMIGRRWDGFTAMIFPNCNGVHTCFMSQSLDLIFVDQNGRVLKTVHSLPPWRFQIGPSSTETVVEMPSASLKEIEIQEGDILGWK